MGIDVTQWRVRIGTFCQSARLKPFIPVLKIRKITIAIRVVLFLLLVVHGVESNPGPGDVGERSCSPKRLCRGISFNRELRKGSANGSLLTDEYSIHTTAKIRPFNISLQNNNVSHGISTITPQSQYQHNSQPQLHPQPLYLLDHQNRSESLSQSKSHPQPQYLSDPQNQSESQSMPQSHSQPLYLPDPQNRSESLSQPQSHSQPLYVSDIQQRPESLSQPQSHSQPLNLSDPRNRPESQSQPQSHSQPLHMPDPQNRPKSQSQPQSHLQPLYLSDPQNRPESQFQPQAHSQPLYLPDPQNRSEFLSQLQSHSQPLYLPDPQNRPESQSQPQSHSQPLYLSDPQNRSESQSQPQSHSQPLYLSYPQNRSESLSQLEPHSQPLYVSCPQNRLQSQSQLQLHTQSQLQPQSPPLSQPQYLSYPHSNPQPQDISHSLLLCQSHLPSQPLPHSQSQPYSQSQPQLQSLSHPHPLSQAPHDTQLLSQSHIWPQSEVQPHPLCQSQLQSRSLCTSLETMMNVWNSSISSDLQLLKELVDSLKSENASLNRRVEDLETFKEWVTKADKGTDIIREDRTGREEKNPKSGNTQEKANLGKDKISQDHYSRVDPPVYQEGERRSGTEPNNCCLSDNREDDYDIDEYSSDEVINDNFVQLLSSENMESSLAEDLKGHIEEDIQSAVMWNVGQHTDLTENLPMKSLKSWIDPDSITKGTGQSIITLLEELCNMLMSSIRYDKDSSDKRKWYLNWSSDRFPPGDYDCILFAVPFNVFFRIVPLPPRSFIAQNDDRYQYECVRLASFSTYRGRGFGVVFAQAGFVFDPKTNMVMCPWCEAFDENHGNLINIHFSGCRILQMTIPFSNAPSPPVPPLNRRAVRQVGGVNVPSAPLQTPNRQPIGRSCSRIRSEGTPALPFFEKKGVRSQEHSRRGSTELSTGLNIHQATLPVASGRPNQTDSFKYATLSLSTSLGAGKSSARSVHSCTIRSCTNSTELTGSLNQCHQFASEHNAIIPFGSSKRAGYSTDSAHVIFSEPSSRGNGNTWEATRGRRGGNDSEVTADAENKETEGTVGVVAASSMYFCQEEIQKYLLTDAAQAVLDMGYQPKVVLRAIEGVLLKRGCEIMTGKSIMEAVLDMEDEEDRAKSQQLPSSSHTITRNKGDQAVGITLRNGSSSDSAMNTKMITMCKICLDNKVSLGFLLCCQLVICQDCSSMYRKCPICKTQISGP